MEENKRLSDLTRMLLSSPSFSSLLNEMSQNPAPVPQAEQPQMQQQQQTQQTQQQQQQEQRQPPKDVNPYNAAMGGQHQQQQIGMAMIPEASVDFSGLALEGEGFSLQPQVFAMQAPEVTGIDPTVLSGKSSNFVGEESFEEDEKVQMPVIERGPLEDKLTPAVPEAPPADPEFEADPAFELYHSSSLEAEEAPLDEDAWERNIFGGVRPEKVLARYELVDAAAEEQSALVAMERVSRMCERLEGTRLRIEALLES